MKLKKINDLYLYGASGHSKVILDIAILNGWYLLNYIDDNLLIKNFNGYAVHNDIKKINLKKNQIFISIGNNSIRKKISQILITSFPVLIHPQSIISSSAIINSGTVLMANTTVNASSIIGSHCIINTNASIDHDCIINDFVHISPNVALAGNVEVGEGVHIGIGACVIQGIKIGKWATIGAGSVIIKDVPDYAVVVGNPGVVIKYNKHEL